VEPPPWVTFPLLLRREPEGQPEQQQHSRQWNTRRLSRFYLASPAAQGVSRPPQEVGKNRPGIKNNEVLSFAFGKTAYVAAGPGRLPMLTQPPVFRTWQGW
jgi:hypothetical protein